MKVMENNNITIDQLAVMIQNGFNETAKKVDVDQRFNQVDQHFDRIEKRLDRIENILIQNHQTRIEKLETSMMELRQALALK